MKTKPLSPLFPEGPPPMDFPGAVDYIGSAHTKLEGHGDDSDESPLISFIGPVFTFLRWSGFTHYRFEFSKHDQVFRYYCGSTLRKIICLTSQILMFIHIYANSQYLNEHTRGSIIYALYKILGYSYYMFFITFCRALMIKGNDFRDIFTFVQGMTKLVRSAGCAIPARRYAKFISRTLLISTVFYGFFFSIVEMDGNSQALWNGKGPTEVVNSAADHFVRIYLLAFGAMNFTEVSAYNFSEEYSLYSTVPLAAVCVIIRWMCALSWLMAFLVNTVFGLLFWKVLYNFFTLVGKSSIRNTLEDIRKFNAITGIIDLYNDAYGWVILSSVITGVCHFSVNIVEMFKDSIPWHMKISVAWSFLMFGAQLLASAQVNQMASEIVDTIKLRFQMEPIWREYHGNCMETTQGMLLVFQEIFSNRIGFRGLGFFTITYSFLGTVLSVISTYSIVVIQFQNSSSNNNNSN